MATKKKAKKVANSAKKAAKRFQPAIDDSIPEGFVLPATAQVPNWDFEKQKILKGEMVTIKTIIKKKVRKGEKKTTRLMVVRQENGALLQVWESKALEGLFDEIKKGKELFLRFDGYAPKEKGRMPMKLFTTAYKK